MSRPKSSVRCAVLLTLALVLLPVTAHAQSFPDGFLPWHHWGKVSAGSGFTLRSAPSAFGGAPQVAGGGFTLRGDYVPIRQGNQAPVIVGLSTLSALDGAVFTAAVVVEDAEDDEIAVALAENPLYCPDGTSGDNPLFEASSSLRTLSSLASMDYMVRGPLPYRVCLSASDGEYTVYATFAIRVEHQLPSVPLWGDCNDSGFVNATDISATILEIFDDDGHGLPPGALTDVPEWLRTPLGQFRGLPEGCNSNRSVDSANETIAAADLACTISRIFGRSCSSTVAAETGDTVLSLALPTEGVADGEVEVTLEGSAAKLGALIFALNVDTSVDIDLTDGDGDGVPDSIVTGAPDEVRRSIVWDAERRQVQVALYTEDEKGFAASAISLGLMVGNGKVDASAFAFERVSAAEVGGTEIPVRLGVNSKAPEAEPKEIQIWLPAVQR